MGMGMSGEGWGVLSHLKLASCIIEKNKNQRYLSPPTFRKRYAIIIKLTRTTTWNLPGPSETRDCINVVNLALVSPLLWRLILT